MEIEVGEYCRTKNGALGKCLKTFFDFEDKLYCDEFITIEAIEFGKFKIPNNMAKKDIIKHSKNIIDLIEDEDTIVLEYYVRKFGKRIQRKFEATIFEDKKIYFDNNHCSFTYDKEQNKWLDSKGFNPKIIEVVTKEMFNSVKYEVE